MKKEMNPHWKAIWVATLRSGNFVQGRTCLRNRDNECCCLGVLCDIIDPKGWRGPEFEYPREFFHNHETKYPSAGVLDKAWLRQSTAGHLGRMNDTGHSFLEIADWIEENL